jgi:spore maturation protein SpmA
MNSKPSAINIIWLSMALIATVVAAYNGNMAKVTASMFDSAKSAVTLAIGLIGPMALWLGIMKVVEAGGMLKLVAKALKPVMGRLFPDVPSDHPAMSSILMNIAANFLGLGNAATPMGIKAMQELDKLNAEKGTATNAMCLFLAINTSSVTFLPLGVITVRASAGVSNPADIFLPTLFATVCSTIVAIIAAKLLQKTSADTAIPVFTSKASSGVINSDTAQDKSETADLWIPSIFQKIFVWGLIAAFLAAVIKRITIAGIPSVTSPEFMSSFSNWLIPVLMCMLLLFGFFRGVKVYETLTDGAKDGFQVAIKIVPFMVAIFVAIGMFRESGALDLLVWLVKPLTAIIGMPPEALPMAILRPLSGSGAYGYMAEIVTKYPNSFLSFFVSTLQGSTETTFYVLAVYFGSVSIRKTRHALAAGLLADAAGILAALFICRIMF